MTAAHGIRQIDCCSATWDIVKAGVAVTVVNSTRFGVLIHHDDTESVDPAVAPAQPEEQMCRHPVLLV